MISNVIVEAKVDFRIIDIGTGASSKVKVQVALSLQLTTNYFTYLLPVFELTAKDVKFVLVSQ